MHASPSFQMTVRCFGVWRAVSLLLVTVAVLVVVTWAPRALEPRAVWVWASIAVLVLASAGVLVQAWRLQPTSLRWDTQCWHLGIPGHAGHEPRSGRLEASMDLGMLMLLRFRPHDASVLHRGTWLPVQRFGHETAWHALRCTVYCARPPSLPTAAPF